MRRVSFLLLAAVVLVSGCSLKTQGGMAMSRGDYPRAIEIYQQALAENPGDVFAVRKLGQAEVYNGDYARAETRFREYLDKHPGDWFSTFYLGMALIGKGDREQGFTVVNGFTDPLGPEENRLVREAVARYKDRADIAAPDLIKTMEHALLNAQEAQGHYDRESAEDGGLGGRTQVRYLTPM